MIVHRERDGCHSTGTAVSLCDLGGDEASFFCQMNMNTSLSRMRCEGEWKVQEVTKFAINNGYKTDLPSVRYIVTRTLCYHES